MYLTQYTFLRASCVVIVVKNLPTSAGDLRDVDSIPGSGRPPGGGHGNLLQCSCLEHPRGQGATVHGVAESQAQLKRLNTHRHFPPNSRLTCLHQGIQFSSVQSLSRVWLFVISRTAAHGLPWPSPSSGGSLLHTFETGWTVDVWISRIWWGDATDFCN